MIINGAFSSQAADCFYKAQTLYIKGKNRFNFTFHTFLLKLNHFASFSHTFVPFQTLALFFEAKNPTPFGATGPVQAPQPAGGPQRRGDRSPLDLFFVKCWLIDVMTCYDTNKINQKMVNLRQFLSKLVDDCSRWFRVFEKLVGRCPH